jgi:gamma-tubulin complex component 2
MDQSDFMVHFMDIAEDEMKKEQNSIKLNRLESLLELSLRITSANSDPYKDDLKVKLFNCDLKTLIEKVTSIGTNSGILLVFSSTVCFLNGFVRLVHLRPATVTT